MFMRIAKLFAVACLLLPLAAEAQATRTWVSGVGDDANPCSRTAPCKTFAGAISKTAAQGQINVLDPGAFGAVTITKSITIDAGEVFAGVLATIGSNGIVINAAATDVVVLRGLTLDGAASGGNGVRILSASRVYIEDCVINNFAQAGVNGAGTTNMNIFVRNSTIRNQFGGVAGTSGGVLIKPSAGATIALLENVALEGNRFGLRVEGNSSATVIGGSLSNNQTFGAIAITTAGPATINLNGTTIAGNSVGARADGALAAVRLTDTLIAANSTGLSNLNGGQIVSFGNNRNDGNGTNGAPTSTVAQQ
jgi:hypothetical protein